ncbi:MAG: BamA/TamA family outer membrane protein [Planctomycetes bacterium]|nr:BamA/TamA family outer membrane protein [Planctomycetota bacterium]
MKCPAFLGSALVVTAALAAQNPGTSSSPTQNPVAGSGEAGAPPAGYDPLAGMDPNGRIPKPQFPSDLVHPERWRYTPPGRIKPGNVFDRFLVSSFLSPVLFREKDIGFGGGFALTDVDFRNQHYREFANIVMTYSEEGQQAYRVFWARWLHHRELPNGGIVREERGRVFGSAGYEKTLTRRFFGFGSRTPQTAETSFTEEVSYVGLGIRDALGEPGDPWLYQLGVRGEHHGLSGGRVLGVPSTEQVFPDLVRAGDGDDFLWLAGSFAHDTRDSIHQPYSGHRFGVSVDGALHGGGSTGAVLGADLRQYFPVPPLLHGGAEGREENPPTDVIALGAFVSDTIGELPYYHLPSLGGSTALRAFVPNRFTDRSAAYAAAEYRFGIVPRGITFTDTIRIERIGIALFGELGTVAPGIEDLADGRWHHSYGFGLRLAFSREASFRIDIGYGDEGSNFTLAFGNAF